MTWTLGYRALQALAVLVVAGLAGVGVTAYDNSRYDNVSSRSQGNTSDGC